MLHEEYEMLEGSCQPDSSLPPNDPAFEREGPAHRPDRTPCHRDASVWNNEQAQESRAPKVMNENYYSLPFGVGKGSTGLITQRQLCTYCFQQPLGRMDYSIQIYVRVAILRIVIFSNRHVWSACVPAFALYFNNKFNSQVVSRIANSYGWLMMWLCSILNVILDL